MRDERLHNRLARLQEKYDPGVGPTMDDAREDDRPKPKRPTGDWTPLSPENLTPDNKDRDG